MNEPTITCPNYKTEIRLTVWAKREERIRCVVESPPGMYGDLQGIAGKTLLEIEGLDIKLLATETPGEQTTNE